jgi:hypothetical protein
MVLQFAGIRKNKPAIIIFIVSSRYTTHYAVIYAMPDHHCNCARVSNERFILSV